MTDVIQKKRFFRDGPPYFDNFEMVVSQLIGYENDQYQSMINIMIDLMKDIHEGLGECHQILGKTEDLVESARQQNRNQEEIEKLVNLCRRLQELETNLANSVVSCTNKIVDDIFP